MIVPEGRPCTAGTSTLQDRIDRAKSGDSVSIRSLVCSAELGLRRAAGNRARLRQQCATAPALRTAAARAERSPRGAACCRRRAHRRRSGFRTPRRPPSHRRRGRPSRESRRRGTTRRRRRANPGSRGRSAAGRRAPDRTRLFASLALRHLEPLRGLRRRGRDRRCAERRGGERGGLRCSVLRPSIGRRRRRSAVAPPAGGAAGLAVSRPAPSATPAAVTGHSGSGGGWRGMPSTARRLTAAGAGRLIGRRRHAAIPEIRAEPRGDRGDGDHAAATPHIHGVLRGVAQHRGGIARRQRTRRCAPAAVGALPMPDGRADLRRDARAKSPRWHRRRR